MKITKRLFLLALLGVMFGSCGTDAIEEEAKKEIEYTTELIHAEPIYEAGDFGNTYDSYVVYADDVNMLNYFTYDSDDRKEQIRIQCEDGFDYHNANIKIIETSQQRYVSFPKGEDRTCENIIFFLHSENDYFQNL